MSGAAKTDSFLGRLNNGDSGAIEQAFLAYEPDLRRSVRRHLDGGLRASGDSEDLVHSVWAHLLPHLRARRWRFETTEKLRAFLIQTAWNRLLNRTRRQSVERHYLRDGDAQKGLPVSSEPAAEQVLGAKELWQQLLALCPPAHRRVLLLKREGRSLDQIAELTGLHKGSVRRILYDVLRRLPRSVEGGATST
jgi:RNA polymerase sigma factor (sigma-70 family)